MLGVSVHPLPEHSPHGLPAGSGRGRESLARHRALVRGHRGSRRGRLPAFRQRPLGGWPGGDVEGPRDAEVAAPEEVAQFEQVGFSMQ